MFRASTDRKFKFYIIMFCLAFASILLFSEIILRLSGRITTETIHVASGQIFDRIPGVFEPGQDVIERPRAELTHHVSINSLGYRGREINQVKKPGTVRILCLGDSFTYGSYVSNNETFPYYLQERFAQDQLPVEIINGGVGGTTIVDQLFFLKKGMIIEPDIVILTFTENDITDLAKKQPMYISLKKNKDLKSKAIIRTVYNISRNTALFNFALLLKAKYSANFAMQNTNKEVDKLAKYENTIEILWKKYEELLKNMQETLNNNSIYFVFAIFPSDHRIQGRSTAEGPFTAQLDRIERLAKNMNIPTLNLLEDLQKANLSSKQLYLLPYDGHPSKVGYAIVANALFEFLQDNVHGILMKGHINAKSN